MAYVFFYLSLFLNHSWYVAFFSILGWISIISIIALVITDMILILIKTTDELPGFWRFVPFITIPTSYILVRIVFYYFPNGDTNILSLLIMILSTISITYLLLKYKTNKFKTSVGIKWFKKKRKGGKDEG
jgi:hypothetical protein